MMSSVLAFHHAEGPWGSQSEGDRGLALSPVFGKQKSQKRENRKKWGQAPMFPFYSCLSASSGSTLMARRAGR